jgi:6-pyruvoyl-tetrahydropterin synthase
MVHGHSYRGRIRVTASRLSSQGFVVDFGVLKSVTAKYDHGDVLTQTAEQLAEEIGRAVLGSTKEQDNAEQMLEVRVVLRETPDGRAEWLWRRG